MSLPGWYPDPSGAPGRYRHWDGATWSAQTTHDPTIPPPLQAGVVSAAIPEQPRRRRLPAVIAAAVAGVLIVGAVIGMWRLTAGDTPIPTNTDTPVATPTASTPSGQSTPSSVSCTSGMGSIDAQADTYTTSGITYEAVPGWGFRFDRDSWPWIDDVAAWGDIGANDYAAGIVIGGVQTRNGFYDLPQAAQASIDCMASHGVFSDQTYTWDMAGETTDIEGMPAYAMLGQVTPEAGGSDVPGYEVHVIVIDVGRMDQLALWISFHPTGDNAASNLIGEAFSTLRRG